MPGGPHDGGHQNCRTDPIVSLRLERHAAGDCDEQLRVAWKEESDEQTALGEYDRGEDGDAARGRPALNVDHERALRSVG